MEFASSAHSGAHKIGLDPFSGDFREFSYSILKLLLQFHELLPETYLVLAKQITGFEGIQIQAWLADILPRLAKTSTADIDTLLPHLWEPKRAQD
ncbi:MAG: hypothetical protein GX564_11090 [Oligosphaeraceae bacterium]|nr:hypothetical protein [Oligosphaeraceae bacterium]